MPYFIREIQRFAGILSSRPFFLPDIKNDEKLPFNGVSFMVGDEFTQIVRTIGRGARMNAAQSGWGLLVMTGPTRAAPTPSGMTKT